MRRLLRPIVARLLRRDSAEIERRAASFGIEDDAGRRRVRSVGEAFLGGYNAMLAARDTASVAVRGRAVDVHYRPFFFEGAATGYLPRGLHDPACSVRNAERDLLALDPAFRYLYYVGLGFWYGFRHPSRPRRLERLAPHVAALYAPLCYDGFGFQQGFFVFAGDVARAASRFERCPEPMRRFAYQGYGRASFFVFMHDEAGFHELRRAAPAAYRDDLEFGRALARAFTGLDRAEEILPFVDGAADGGERAARLLGTTWALAARLMNDPAHFTRCLARVDPQRRAILERLPELCERARAGAVDYGEWQSRTLEAALSLDARS